MVSAHPPVSSSSRPLIKPLEIVPREPVIIGITVTFMFHNFFCSLGRSSTCLFSFSLIFKVHYSAGSLFSFLLLITRSDLVTGIRVICLYIKIPEDFLCLIFLNWFYFVHISFGRMVKFQIFVQFPVDPLPNPIGSCLIRLLCEWSWRLHRPHNLHLLFCCISIIISYLEPYNSLPKKMTSALNIRTNL